MAGLAGVGLAKTLGNEIKKAVENGSLSVNVRGTVFVPDKQSVNISEPERLCDTGQVYQDGVCGEITMGSIGTMAIPITLIVLIKPNEIALVY